MSALPPESGHLLTRLACPLCAKSRHMRCSKLLRSDSQEIPSHSPSSPSPLRVGMAGVSHDRPQDWIVSVALLRAAIERLAIEWAKRHIEIKPGHKVRVADEELAKRDEIGASLRDGLVGAHFVEAVIGHEEPAEAPLDCQIVKGRNRGPARVALDHMKISETFTRQCRGDVVEQALRIAVSDVVLPVLR